MEEAERLCDRIALIDAGRIVALDTPAGIVSRARLEQRVQFRPSAPLNVELLTDLAEVHDVTFAVGLVVAALAPTARAGTALGTPLLHGRHYADRRSCGRPDLPLGVT
jgi:ABC-2 type transport system ATP-binding protein